MATLTPARRADGARSAPAPARPSTRARPVRRAWPAVVLEALTGVGALVGGANLVGDGLGMDPSLLAGTPFTTWTWPGVALMAVVGTPMLAAAVAEWRRAPRAPVWSLGAGVVLMGWITVQVALIGYQTGLQPTFFLVGLTLGALSAPRARAVPPAGA